MAFQSDSIYWVEVEKIVPNPFQPRREFDEGKLKELAESIRMYGVLQPLTVTRQEVQGDDGSFFTEYELIAGERRLRASRLAGLAQVPVIIREGEQSQQEKLELAIIENLQREDLNAIDRAIAFRQLADVFSLSHSQIAKKVGRSREYVSNSIRLLALPDYMQDSVRLGDITEGHSRTLLTLNDRPEEQDVVFREVLFKKLSVRETEKIVRGLAQDKIRKKSPQDTIILNLEKEFTEALGTRVSIVTTDFGGKLTIDYFSMEDLEGMLGAMRTEMANLGIKNSYKNSYENHTGDDFQNLTESTPLTAVTSASVEEKSEDFTRTRKEDGGAESGKLANFVAPLPAVVAPVNSPAVLSSAETQSSISHERVVEMTDKAGTVVTSQPEKVATAGQPKMATADLSASVNNRTPELASEKPRPVVSALQQQLNNLLGRNSSAVEKTIQNESREGERGSQQSEVLSHQETSVNTPSVNELAPESVSTPRVGQKNDSDDDLYSVRDFGI